MVVQRLAGCSYSGSLAAYQFIRTRKVGQPSQVNDIPDLKAPDLIQNVWMLPNRNILTIIELVAQVRTEKQAQSTWIKTMHFVVSPCTIKT